MGRKKKRMVRGEIAEKGMAPDHAGKGVGFILRTLESHQQVFTGRGHLETLWRKRRERMVAWTRGADTGKGASVPRCTFRWHISMISFPWKKPLIFSWAVYILFCRSLFLSLHIQQPHEMTTRPFGKCETRGGQPAHSWQGVHSGVSISGVFTFPAIFPPSFGFEALLMLFVNYAMLSMWVEGEFIPFGVVKCL